MQRFSLHDGSGIRTLVFLKGCPLRCQWCSNPEGQACAPQLAYREARCIGRSQCGDACRRACDVDAIRTAGADQVAIDLERCTACGACVEACPSQALELLGRWMDVQELLRSVEEDDAFYARSGGGLTLSGGEPLLQADFAARLLEAARERGIDTAVETSGYAPWRDVERVSRHADQIFYDVKSLDPRKHREGTAVGNEPILANLEKLCAAFPELPITVRTPVVPGFNDSADEIRAIADFVHRLPGRVRYELLPYHRFGEPKYRQLGRDYALGDVEPPSAETMAALNAAVEASRRRAGAPA